MSNSNRPGVGHNSRVRVPLAPGSGEYQQAINEVVSSFNVTGLVEPAVIGALGETEPLARLKAIHAAYALAVAKRAHVEQNSQADFVLLHFICVHSDNQFGRCAEPLRRMALFTGMHERSVRRRLEELSEAKIIGRATQGGHTSFVWLLYPEVVLSGSAYDVLAALAPKSEAKRGRPRIRVPLADANGAQAAALAENSGHPGCPPISKNLGQPECPLILGDTGQPECPPIPEKGGQYAVLQQQLLLHRLPLAEIGRAEHPRWTPDLAEPRGCEILPDFIKVSGNRIAATLPNGTGKTLVRTVLPPQVDDLAALLSVSAESARRRIIDEFDVWRESNYCGAHDGWLHQLMKDIVSRANAVPQKEHHAFAVSRDNDALVREFMGEEPEAPVSRVPDKAGVWKVAGGLVARICMKDGRFLDRRVTGSDIEAASRNSGISPEKARTLFVEILNGWVSTRSAGGKREQWKSNLFLEVANTVAARSVQAEVPDHRHAKEFYAANTHLLGNINGGDWED